MVVHDDKQETIQESRQIPWAWFKAMNDLLSHRETMILPKATVSLPVPLLDWLYLSDLDSVDNDVLLLKELKITHVLTTNFLPTYQRQNLKSQLQVVGIQHYYVGGIDDESYEMIGKHWNECCRYLKKCKEARGCKVVIHCAAGINRSGLMAAAAMMVFEDLELMQVVRILKKRRGVVLTNESFQLQLCLLAAELNRLGPKPEGYTDDWP